MEEAIEGEKAVVAFVTVRRGYCGLRWTVGQGTWGKHEGYCGQQKSYPGKTKNQDKSLISVLHALKNIFLFCKASPKDSNLDQ